MKLARLDPPRAFGVGTRGGRLTHTADVWLADDEQMTFRAESGSELDVVRKSWGYYATPSTNGRMRDHGLRAVLALGKPQPDSGTSRMYLLAVEEGHEAGFEAYLAAEGMRIACWLDDDDAVAEAARRLGRSD